MGRAIWVLLAGLLLSLVGSVVVAGREATVWGAANAMPAPARTLTASVLRGATGPMVLVEDTFKIHFGGDAALEDLVSCGGIDACTREKERYIPEKQLQGVRGRMAVETDGSCLFWASLAHGQYFTTQISLRFVGEEGEAFAVGNLYSAERYHEAELPYLIEPAGCAFAIANMRAFRWELLSAKGFRSSSEKSTT